MIEIPYQFTGTVAYQTYEQIEARVKLFPSYENIGKDSSGTYNMYAVKLGNPDKPTLQLNGCMHGTEWHTTQYTLSFMEQLRDNTFPDKSFRDNLLNNYFVVYIPTLNPYGVNQVTDPYLQFNNKARRNFNGIDLNTDFDEADQTQQETKNFIALVQKYRPFAYIDCHMFQGDYDVAYDRDLIIGNGQTQTKSIQFEIADSWANYAGREVTRWAAVNAPTSGLARAYVARQSNPYTKYTLAYITEMCRPSIINGSLYAPLSEADIYKFGMASIYLFFKTSMDYLEQYYYVVEPNKNLVVTDLAGKSEILTDYQIKERKRVVNGEYSLPFVLFKTERNAHAFDLVQEESIVTYDGQEYRIKKMREYMKGQACVKDVQSVQHVFFDIIDDFQYDALSGTINIVQALNHVFGPTEWTWVNHGAFASVEFDNFGNGNSLELFKTLLERYGAEFEITGKRQITLKNQIGNLVDTQFRYQYNIKTLYKDIDTSNLSTYIKGYGKPYDDKNIAISPVNYDSRTGTWDDVEDSDHYTTQVGATFTVTFTGTGCSLRHYANNQGGIWEFVADNGAKKATVSTWNSTGINKTTDVFKDLPQGAHTIVATFKGADPSHAPTGGTARGWVRHGDTDFQKTFDIYRERVGDEKYTCVAEYTSPNAAVYKIRHAPPISDERYTIQANLLEHLQKVINDTPDITIEIDIAELGFECGLGDTVYLIHEDLGIDATVRVLEYTDYPESYKTPTVVLSNFKKSLTSALTTFQNTNKTVKQLTDADGNLSLALKKIYRNSNHFSDSRGDWYIDPDNPNAFVFIGSGGIDVHNGLIRVEREDGYASILGGIIQHGFNIQGSVPTFKTANVEEVGQFYRTATQNRFENVQRFVFKHDSRYLRVIANMSVDGGTDMGNIGSISFDVFSDDETLSIASVTVTETRKDEDQGYRKDILLDLGTPTGNILVCYWRMYSSKSYYTYGSVRYIAQEG